MRTLVIAGNWKMNHGYRDTEKYFSALAEGWEKSFSELIQAGVFDVRLYPPLLSCVPAMRKLGEKNIPVKIGAQNVHWENSGAFTGEVSASMLKELGITHALVGHSERRQYFGETDETARKRTKHLIQNDFQVIHCIGETLEEREAGRTEEVLLRQLKQGLEKEFFGKKLVLAYEPVWAIGTGKTASPAQAQEAHALIRNALRASFGESAAQTSILYGGSVKPDNLPSILDGPDVDGALIGGASLKPDQFLELVQTGARSLRNGVEPDDSGKTA